MSKVKRKSATAGGRRLRFLERFGVSCATKNDTIEENETDGTKGDKMITGGSNYVNVNWSWDNPVIGTYHLFREKVESDLREMFEHGQRKISLVCWYAPLNFPGAIDHRWGHVIDSYGGVMFGQHQQNLIDLLALIGEMGFNQVNFRFAATAKAGPGQWTEWDREQFNEDWAFTDSVRDLIVANTSLPVIFDLGVEHAKIGLTDDTLRQLFVRRMWRLYTEAHGPDDSCGFSIIHGPDGLRPMLNQFRVGKLPMPSCYCFDNYTTPRRVLTESAEVLRAVGEQDKPVYMQETFYNDAQAYSEIKDAVAQSGLNFKGIFQWPRERTREPHDFPDVFPKRFDNYLVEA